MEKRSRGCPQGSCFGPLLWNMFQNDLNLVTKVDKLEIKKKKWFFFTLYIIINMQNSTIKLDAATWPQSLMIWGKKCKNYCRGRLCGWMIFRLFYLIKNTLLFSKLSPRARGMTQLTLTSNLRIWSYPRSPAQLLVVRTFISLCGWQWKRI